MVLQRCALIAFCVWALAHPAAAQTYPARPVTIVAPYAAGGGADLIARLMAQKLGERLHQSFVVENRLGAGGVIAASSVAKATPDGYTLFMGASTQLAIQVTLHKTLPYRTTSRSSSSPSTARPKFSSGTDVTGSNG